MNLTHAIVAADPDTDQETLNLLLDDREWVQAEFAAIMSVSGFGSRIIIGTIPHHLHSDRVRWAHNAMNGRSETTRMGPRMSMSRERSPPGC